MAIWVQVVEPFYLPNYQSSKLHGVTWGTNQRWQNESTQFIPYLMICLAVYRLRFAYFVIVGLMFWGCN